MSDYTNVTLSSTDDIDFTAEFIEFLNKRNAYLNLILAQAWNGQALAGLPPIVGGIGIVAKGGIGSIATAADIAAGAVYHTNGFGVKLLGTVEEYAAHSAALAAKAFGEGIVGTAEGQMLKHLTAAEMKQLAKDLAAGVKNEITERTSQGAMELFLKEQYGKPNAAFLPTDLFNQTRNQQNNANSNEAIARAILAMLNAKATLLAAIANSFGDYRMVKFVSETNRNANTLVLGLRPPLYATGEDINTDSTSTTLGGTVNPHHINTGAYFKWGTTTAYGHFLPITPSPLGHGENNIAFTQVLSGLAPSNTYHFRLFAVSRYLGAFQGEDKSFITQGSSDFTVTFDGNGNDGGDTASQTDNAPALLNANGFTQAGYTFNKWNTEANGSGTDYADGAEYPFDADVTLYAQWSVAASHTVIFSGNGNDSGSMDEQTANRPTALTTNAFVKVGFSFDGWNVSIGGGGDTTYANGATYPFNADVTLYAQWTPVNHTVTFNGNESTGGATAAQTTNIPTALTANGFTRTGFVFDSWNTAVDGSGTIYVNSADYAFDADVILYAQWTGTPHTVTFDGNGNDSGSMSPQEESEPTALTLNGFSRTGFQFTNWLASGGPNDGQAYNDGAEYPFDANTTLFAQWGNE